MKNEHFHFLASFLFLVILETLMFLLISLFLQQDLGWLFVLEMINVIGIKQNHIIIDCFV